jgi:hypothetical protein
MAGAANSRAPNKFVLIKLLFTNFFFHSSIKYEIYIYRIAAQIIIMASPLNPLPRRVILSNTLFPSREKQN